MFYQLRRSLIDCSSFVNRDSNRKQQEAKGNEMAKRKRKGLKLA